MMELGPGSPAWRCRRGVASIGRRAGTMKVTEQWCLETMAYDRYAYCVVTRVGGDLMFPWSSLCQAVGVASGGSPPSISWSSPGAEFMKGIKLLYHSRTYGFGCEGPASAAAVAGAATADLPTHGTDGPAGGGSVGQATTLGGAGCEAILCWTLWALVLL